MARLADRVLSDTEGSELTALVTRRETAQALASRARIVLDRAAGSRNKDVAAHPRLDPATVGEWRRRFVERRRDGSYDDPRSGAPHWSSRGMSRASGLSVSSVRRIGRAIEFRRFLDEIEKAGPDDLDVHLGDGQPRRPRDAADPQPAGQAATLSGPPDADGLVLDQPSRALLRAVDRAPDQTRRPSFRRRATSRHPRLSRPPQRRSKAVPMDQIRRSDTRIHRALLRQKHSNHQ